MQTDDCFVTSHSSIFSLSIFFHSDEYDDDLHPLNCLEMKQKHPLSVRLKKIPCRGNKATDLCLRLNEKQMTYR